MRDRGVAVTWGQGVTVTESQGVMVTQAWGVPVTWGQGDTATRRWGVTVMQGRGVVVTWGQGVTATRGPGAVAVTRRQGDTASGRHGDEGTRGSGCRGVTRCRLYLRGGGWRHSPGAGGERRRAGGAAGRGRGATPASPRTPGWGGEGKEGRQCLARSTHRTPPCTLVAGRRATRGREWPTVVAHGGELPASGQRVRRAPENHLQACNGHGARLRGARGRVTGAMHDGEPSTVVQCAIASDGR